MVKPARETPPDRQVGHLLGAIFSACPDAVLVVDHTGTIVLSNPAVAKDFPGLLRRVVALMTNLTGLVRPLTVRLIL